MIFESERKMLVMTVLKEMVMQMLMLMNISNIIIDVIINVMIINSWIWIWVWSWCWSWSWFNFTRKELFKSQLWGASFHNFSRPRAWPLCNSCCCMVLHHRYSSTIERRARRRNKVKKKREWEKGEIVCDSAALYSKVSIVSNIKKKIYINKVLSKWGHLKLKFDVLKLQLWPCWSVVFT